jgi:hypothetical protein
MNHDDEDMIFPFDGKVHDCRADGVTFTFNILDPSIARVFVRTAAEPRSTMLAPRKILFQEIAFYALFGHGRSGVYRLEHG